MGYLLHKNPALVHSFELPFGKAHVFYPELAADRSEAALLLDIDPIGLVRRRLKGAEGGLHQYVNDRPYAASSFLSVAMSQVFGTAMGGRSKERQELADQPLQFDALVTALPCRGGTELLNRLFEPLGYLVEAKHYHLDERFPEWELARITQFGSGIAFGCKTCSRTSMSLSRSWTPRSITGSGKTKSTNCFAREKVGWRTTLNVTPSSHAISDSIEP